LGLIVKEGIGGERAGDFMDNFNVHVLPIQFEQLFLLLSLLIITFRSVIYRGYWQSKSFQNSFTRYPCGSIASASKPQPNLTCNIRLICPFLHLINQFRLGSWITLAPITSNDIVWCAPQNDCICLIIIVKWCLKMDTSKESFMSHWWTLLRLVQMG
jgi:hypothetical protein